MAIVGDNEEGFTLRCDSCGYKVKGFDTFQEAVDYKKENGWCSVKEDGEWSDLCPHCADARMMRR